MAQKNRSMDDFNPLVMRQGCGNKCSRSLSLGHGDQEARRVNQNFKTSSRDLNTAERYLGRSDGLIFSNSYIKYNKTFHKRFQEIPEEERLIHAFTCALQREVLYHGKLFVSENNVCFHSTVLLKETKVVIPFSSVKEIKKHNPALSVLSLQTFSGEKYLFASISNYAVCYKLLLNLCFHSKDSPTSGPYTSSPELEAEPDVASSVSSSDSFEIVELKDGFSLVNQEANGTCKSTQSGSCTTENNKGGSWIWRLFEKVVFFLFFREALSLRVVFHIFVILMLLLLLVFGYIGLRITALEKQLSSLGALVDWTSHYTKHQET